jgi:hypothetical protein
MFAAVLTLYVLPTFYYLIEAWQIRRDRKNSFELIKEKEAGELV